MTIEHMLADIHQQGPISGTNLQAISGISTVDFTAVESCQRTIVRTMVHNDRSLHVALQDSLSLLHIVHQKCVRVVQAHASTMAFILSCVDSEKCLRAVR